MAKDTRGLTATKVDDTAEWYEQVCLKSELADFGPVKGTAVIRPRGYYIWEQIQQYFTINILDKYEVDNAYFPLFIPESFFTREADHAEGFAPELAWIATANDDADLKKERAIIRPTSETLVLDSFKKWLQTYKQLPMKINQWANVVRWEVKQTKLFLRGREFLWQEGHCLYADEESCDEEVQNIITAYSTMCKDLLALPTIVGQKTEAEKFPGAKKTFTIESLMHDGKAVQMGTSHNLGQGFTKGFEVEYKGSDEKMHNPYYSSWGVSTRLIGAMVMTHSDDKGLILPPKLARQKVIIVPMSHKNNVDEITAACAKLADELSAFGAMVDDRDDYSLGWKLNEWELKGAPLVLILGGRELEAHSITLKMRDEDEKRTISLDKLSQTVSSELESMHTRLYEKANAIAESKIITVKDKDEFAAVIAEGKVAKVLFCGEKACEDAIEAEFNLTSRCISPEPVGQDAKCVFSDKPAIGWVYFSRSY